MKTLLSTTLIIALYLLAPVSLSAQNAVSTETSATEEAIVSTLTVKVTGIGCATDIRTISAKVNELEGIVSCEAAKRGAVTRFEVQYYPSQVSVPVIHAAVEDTPGCKNPDDRPYRVKL